MTSTSLISIWTREMCILFVLFQYYYNTSHSFFWTYNVRHFHACIKMPRNTEKKALDYWETQLHKWL